MEINKTDYRIVKEEMEAEERAMFWGMIITHALVFVAGVILSHYYFVGANL